MGIFKVICKATNRNSWETIPRQTKIVTTYKFFGLIKDKKIISEPNRVPGPDKDEICIVTEEYVHSGITYYKLAGYPYGGYDSKHFIKLDEFSETQKEIVKKVEYSTN